MSIALYMDHHVPMAITRGLRRRGVEVITAQEDDTTRMFDPLLLDRATSLNRVLFTQDEDFLREAARRQEQGEPFAGVVYAHQQRINFRRCIDDLEIIAKVVDPLDLAGQVIYLPL